MAHVKGKGTVLKVTLDAVLTAIPAVVSLVPPGWSNDKVDITDLDSTWMECDSTIPDPAAITGILNYDPADAVHQDLEALAASGASAACEVLPPTGGKKYTFSAYVSQWSSESVDVKAIHKKSFALQPIGAITVASV